MHIFLPICDTVENFLFYYIVAKKVKSNVFLNNIFDYSLKMVKN